MKRKIDPQICKICGKELHNKRALAGHTWLMHQFRIGIKHDLEREIERLKGFMCFEIPCKICKNPITFNMTKEKDRADVIRDITKLDKYYHIKCRKK
jgi:hypothetical protein